VQLGDIVTVKITDVDVTHRRIALSHTQTGGGAHPGGFGEGADVMDALCGEPHDG
jgi:transcriptional accessory protein Tex/SPT6